MGVAGLQVVTCMATEQFHVSLLVVGVFAHITGNDYYNVIVDVFACIF